MKYGQLTQYKKTNIFLQKLRKKEGRDTSSRPLFVFQKSFTWVKNKWSTAWFQYILTALNLSYNKNKLYKILDYWSGDTLNIEFLEKGLGIVSLPHFVYDFSRKMFIML